MAIIVSCTLGAWPRANPRAAASASCCNPFTWSRLCWSRVANDPLLLANAGAGCTLPGCGDAPTVAIRAISIYLSAFVLHPPLYTLYAANLQGPLSHIL